MEKAAQGASRNLIGHWHCLCHPPCGPGGTGTQGLWHCQSSGSDEVPAEVTKHADSFLGLQSFAQPQCSMGTGAAPSASSLPILMEMALTLDALYQLQTVSCKHTKHIRCLGGNKQWYTI